MPAEHNQLSEARALAEQAAQLALRTGERLKRALQRVKEVERAFDPQDGKKVERRNKLVAERDEAERAFDAAKAAKRDAANRLSGLQGILQPTTDPRQLITDLEADVPILLFPMRLETHFSTMPGQSGQPCLLVRVYPDDELVDTFEETLSTTEVANAKIFWSGWWKSQDVPLKQRAYWHDLVSAQGKGRARHAALRYQPDRALSDPQPGANTADVILVIPSYTALTFPEKGLLNTYWEAVWRANGDATASQQALDVLVGGTTAARANELIAGFAPFNLKEPTSKRGAEGNDDYASPIVRVVHTVFTDPATLDLRTTAWASQPKAWLLPDRFVLVLEGVNAPRMEVLGAPVLGPLAAGPDPRAAREEQYQPIDGGDLSVPEEQQWMFDFERALAVGMAFRVPLDPIQVRLGFKKVYVAGLRITEGPEEGSGELAKLIQHHHESSAGFELLPQGTPTNRTEGDSGETVWQGDDGFDAFAREVAEQKSFDVTITDERQRQDGAVLADALGIDPDVLQPIANADGTDMAEAHRMNAALWPATMGYWMDTMMNTVFSDEAIGRTRVFFEKHVSGRGALPAVRIGDQPYGILPTTAFSRLAFASKPQSVGGQQSFESELHAKLKLLREGFWNERAADAAHVGKVTSDPQQLLLDILGLHPASVEFHQQWAESLDEFWNRLHLTPFFNAAWWAEVIRLLAAPAALRDLGHTGEDPDLLKKIFSAEPILLSGAVIDDRPLSENEGLQASSPEGNYLHWLAAKAAISLDALRSEGGFTDNKRPGALLYLMLHHALELGFHSTAVGMKKDHVGAIAMRALRTEQPFIHIQDNGASESRYALLYESDIAITGSADLPLADHIINVLGTAPATLDLKGQIDAITQLAELSTAKLERLFAEHIDLCTHRLDAWLLGFVHQRLQDMRASRATGLAIGAYGYVEDLHAKPAPQPITIDPDEALILGTSTAIVDPANGGYIHAPSADQAATAAILRNAHINHATPTQPDLFAIDLSSERVRVAMGLIEGLRNGQSLGALLGYRFERGLHDPGGSVELDRFIFSIRMAFPLRANKMADTVDEEGSIETIEARNVVDGQKLMEHVIAHHDIPYPWGKDLLRGPGEDRINEEVKKLKEANDALADLTLAESVHQMARGNTERAAATMDMFSKGTFPVQPEVVRMQRSGTVLTHRMALHFDVTAPATDPVTPRAMAEPAVNAWLKTVLPALNTIVIGVNEVAADGTVTSLPAVSWSALDLDAIDLLHMLDMHNEKGMNAIDDRVIEFLRRDPALLPDRELRLMYTEPVAGQVTLFEVAPLVESLRTLLLGVRAWKPQDASLPSEASKVPASGTVNPDRVQDQWNAMETLRVEADELKKSINRLPPDAEHFYEVLGAVDEDLRKFIDIQKRAGNMGVALAGFGGAMETKRAWFAMVRKRFTAGVIDDKGNKNHVDRWQEKWNLSELKVQGANDSELSDYARIELLKEAEAAVSTVFTRGTLPNPLTLIPFRSHVDALRSAFSLVHQELRDVGTTTDRTFAALYSRWETAVLHMAAHDPTPMDLDPDRAVIIALMQDMSRAVDGLVNDLQARLDKSEAKLAEARAATAEQQITLRIDAMKALMGDDVLVLPRYTLAADQAAEWTNAWNDRSNKIAFVQGQGADRPMDEWLYGVARVRGKAAAWENMLVMSEAFGTATPLLEPVQFPFRASEPWMALQWPHDFKPHDAGDHLLYTSAYAGGVFNPANAQCGLLLDEWTEVIPGEDESTNIAFNYDRPSNEAPQAWLLAVPASTGSHWNWDDLRQTIPDTIELARMRAVEPRAFDNSPIARFLPATIAAVTTRRVTMGVDLARNIKSELLLQTALTNG
ncbi:MAG: hypothetical protein ABI432_02595 [Flavobacteriales bacterium]